MKKKITLNYFIENYLKTVSLKVYSLNFAAIQGNLKRKNTF